MSSARFNFGLEPGSNWADAALDTPKPQEPCTICQRLVDFLFSCTEEEPDSDNISVCVLTTWSVIQHNDGCPTCQKVVKTFSRLDPSNSYTEDAHIRVQHPWEGNFVIILRRDCQDENQDIGYSLSPLGDNTPWAGYMSGVLVDALWVDMGRIQKWLGQCDSSHNGICRDAPGMTDIKLPDILYLVDVENKCIIVANGIPKYIALSYVWAHASNQCELTQENLVFMQQPGSLNSHQIISRMSGTIRAAMSFGQLIGVRYLWVDRLCIIQNDSLRKDEQIDAMGGIYLHSYLTLAVADSDDSSSGLRGIEGVTQPRHLPQTVYTFHASPHSVTAFIYPFMRPRTVYDTRGWTFQEQMLAKRTLMFTPDGMRWICQSCDYRERQVDLQFPLSGWNSTGKNMTYAYTVWPNVKLWDTTLSTYLERHLTYEEDILRAFAGIMNVLSGGFPGGFHFGLPELFFDAALLWRPYSFLERRTSSTGLALPSWSWCGWKGQIRSGINGFGTEHMRTDPIGEGERGRHIITFPSKFPWKKTAADKRKLIDVYNLWHIFRDDALPRKFDPAKPLPPGWSVHQFEEGTAYYTHHAAPGYTFYYPIPTTYDWKNVPAEIWGPVLRVITIRVFLHIGNPLCFPDSEEIEEEDGDQFGMFSLVDSHDEWVGVLHVNLEPTDDSRILGERCELIMLSSSLARNNLSDEMLTSDLPELAADVGGKIPEWYEFINVMWIERKENIAYRKGIGRVLTKVFKDDEFDPCGRIVLLG